MTNPFPPPSQMGLAYDDEEGSDSEAEDEAREDAEEEAELDAIERRYLEEAEADADYEVRGVRQRVGAGGADRGVGNDVER